MLTLVLAILGAILVLFLLTPAYAYLSSEKKYKKTAILVKGLNSGVSFGFALAGFIMWKNQTTIANPDSYMVAPQWVLIAIGLCVLGDVCLNVNFIAGGILFFLGHIAYIIFFLTLAAFNNIAFLLYTLLCAACLCYFYQYSTIVKRFHLLFVLYAMTILATLTFGLLLPYTYGWYGFLPAAASFFLVSSDFILARNKLTDNSKVLRLLSLTCYFGGQYLMAMTIYFAV